MKKTVYFLLLILGFTQANMNALTEADVARIFQQQMKNHSTLGEIKSFVRDYAIQGAGYTACAAGFIYGLNHLGDAYKNTIKYYTPITDKAEQEQKRYSRLSYSHSAVGLLCCGASTYGLYRLLHY